MPAYITQDLVRILRRLGVRALCATHLHELEAHGRGTECQYAGDSRILSLVASHHTTGETPPCSRRTRSCPATLWGAVTPAKLRSSMGSATSSSAPCSSGVVCWSEAEALAGHSAPCSGATVAFPHAPLAPAWAFR